MDWKKLLGSITESVDEEIRLRNAYLAVENRIFRQQILEWVHLTDTKRKTLAEIGQQLGKQALEETATIAKPDTILAWHREFMDQQGVRPPRRQSVGRPRIDMDMLRTTDFSPVRSGVGSNWWSLLSSVSSTAVVTTSVKRV